MSEGAPVPRGRNIGELPLSRAQESMWFLCRFAQDTTVYNLPAAVRLRGPLATDALRQAFDAIVARHEILRTVFPAVDGAPRQVVRPHLRLPLEMVDLSELPPEAREDQVRELARAARARPFDLVGGPLFRLQLYRLGPNEHVLMTVFHHLVWDGWSIGIFVAELAAHYEAARRSAEAALPELPIQYADFALWESGWLEQRMDQRITYWRDALRGHGVLDVPTDRPRPAVQTYSGEILPLQLPATLGEALERVSRAAETTPYRTLLAAFAALLGRWSGQERFALGTPVANRHQQEVTPLIGFFANLLPIPVDLGGDPSFSQILERIKTSTAGAFAHQDIPFDSLVEGLGVGGDPSRNPIAQTVFALHQESLDAVTLDDLQVEPVFLESDTTHFDLALHLWRRAGSVSGYFSYNTDLFERATVARLGSHFVTLLTAALSDPDAALSSLPLLVDSERAWLSAKITDTPERGGRPAMELLAERAAAYPGRSAADRDQTWETVVEKASGVASALKASGVAPGTRVAVSERDPLDRIAAVWAAWLAGAVPVSIDPAETDTRQAELRAASGAHPVAGGDEEAASSDVAYVSLAPGYPVELSHQQLTERLQRLQAHLPLEATDAVYGVPDSAADAFVVDGIWPLAAGARIATELKEATVVHATPEALGRLLDAGPERPSAIHTVLCSGGYLSVELAEAARARFGCKVVYLYSPPEIGTEVGIARFGSSGSTGSLASAGRPLLGVRVLDGAGALVPIGVPGRIWVGESATADRGRWREDGSLELLGAARGSLWRGGTRHSLERVYRALLSDRSVLACHVLTRREQLCAYVVTTGMAPVARIAASADLPPILEPRVLPITRVPRDADGRVDEAALLRLPVIDQTLGERWERALLEVEGVEHARVAVHDLEPEQARVHLDDLVPGWRRRRTTDRTSTTDSASDTPSVDGHGVTSSYCRGEDLQIPDGAPITLVAALQEVAQRWGNQRGLTVYETASEKSFLSYAELLARARRVAAGLRAQGLEPGDRVVLQIERLADHFVAFWGCVLAGVAPVGVAAPPSYTEKNAVLAKLWNTWTLLREPPIVASDSLCDPLREAGALYGADFDTVPFEGLEDSEASAELPEADPEDVVFLQLTSGSTGVPKCIPETHRAIIAQVLGARQMNEYTDDDVSLNWLSLDHVVPLLTCHLRDTYLGLPQIHVRGQAVLVDPLLWLDLIEEYRVTLSWAPNFGFKLVNDALAKAGDRSWDLSSLRWVMNAGEQVTLPVGSLWARNLARFGVRPHAMQPGYGMAEVATAITYANDFEPDAGARTVRKDSLAGVLVDAPASGRDTITFVDVGPPIPGVELRIATAEGRVLPESVVGQVQVRGRVTMPGYLFNDEANAEAFVGDGWFDTGDLGFVHEGRLTITGRTKEMIIVRGANFYCYEIEEVVNNTPGVLSTFSAACAMDDPQTGTEGLAVFFVPDRETAPPDAGLLRAVRQNVTREFGVTPTYVVPMAREAFPKTTSGKIQRTRLKKRLAEGGFDDVLREIDLLTGQNTLPAWFLEWGWRRSRLEHRRPERAGATIVLDAWRGPDASGNGSATMGGTPSGAALAQLVPHANTVLVGSTPVSDTNGDQRFSIDPLDPGDLGRAVDAVRGSHGAIRCAIALEPSPEALLVLSQALASEEDVRLVVVATEAVATESHEALDPSRAALRGLVETLSLEWHGLDACLLDVTGEPDAAEAILAESGALTKDRVVAYRGGRRLVPVLREPRFGVPDLMLGIGDLILVTGGLGGVGGELCKHLLTQYGVRLLVTGRSSLDAGDHDAAHQGLGQKKDVAERRATLAELESLGDILFRQADATDHAAMARAIAAAEERFGTHLRGAVHLAGVFPPRLLAEETPASLLATMAPKVEGARILDELLPEDGPLVLFGSVYGTFGAAACGGYAAANVALDGVASRRTGPTRVIAWSNWDDLGMSRGYALGESSKALGFDMIGARQACASFDAALCARAPSLLVGLDSRRPNVSRYLEGAPEVLQSLVAYHNEPSDPAAVSRVQVFDVGGRPTRCTLVPLSEVPLDESGELDLSSLEAVCRSSSVDAVLPRTSTERTVAAIWQDVLEIDRIDIDANFFSLGGQSLLLLQVMVRLEQSFGRDIAVVDLFRYPTVRSLAAFLGESAPKKRTFDDAADRARKQRAARRARGRTRGRT